VGNSCRARSLTVIALRAHLPATPTNSTPAIAGARKRPSTICTINGLHLSRRYAFPVASLPRQIPVGGVLVALVVVMPSRWLRCRDAQSAVCCTSLGGSLCLPGGFVAETSCPSDRLGGFGVVMPSRWLRCRDEKRKCKPITNQCRYAFPVASLPRRFVSVHGRSPPASLCLPGGFVAETCLGLSPAHTSDVVMPSRWLRCRDFLAKSGGSESNVVMPSRWLRCRDFMNKSNARGASRRYAFPVASLPRPSRIRCGLLCGMVVMPSRWLRCRDQVEKTCITLHVSRYAFPVASLPRPLHPPASRPFSSSLCLPGGFVTETVPLRRAGRGAFASLCLLSGFVIETP